MSTSAPGADRIPAALQHSPPAPLPSASSHRLRLTRPLEINLRRAPDPPKTSPRRTHTRAPYRRLTAPPWHKKKQVTAPIVHSSPTGLDQLTASRLILADPCLTRALSARLAETSPITVRRCAMGPAPLVAGGECIVADLTDRVVQALESFPDAFPGHVSRQVDGALQAETDVIEAGRDLVEQFLSAVWLLCHDSGPRDPQGPRAAGPR